MANVSVPMLDLGPQIEANWEAFNEAFQRVMRNKQFILGPEERAFEQEAASYLNCKHAIGLNSGTDALFIALRALGIGPGDEVITTPFTFFATAEAISHVGATPVFVDIDETSLNLDPALVAASITDRTRAIIPVHLFGRPCDMDALLSLAEAHGLAVVEDCAQSFGADWKGRKTGVMGRLGCYSFFPTKNLNAFGDGGLLVTNDEELAATCRMLRLHGSRKKYFNETVGYNSRLDELHAAMLRVKLPLLDGWNAQRRNAAGLYRKALEGIPGVIFPEIVDGHVFHQVTIRETSGRRDELQAGLAERGIPTMVYYPIPCHKLKLYQASHASVSCPIAEKMAEQVLSLPIWPELQAEDIDKVAAAVKGILVG